MVMVKNIFMVLEFEGEYLNNQRNERGKEYHDNGKLKFEGEYLNGKRNGKGKEYNINEKLIYDGKYIDGERLLKIYDRYGSLIDDIYNVNYVIKEYYSNKLKYEGEYQNGSRNGKGKEYNDKGELEFEGEYLNGNRNGKGKEYDWNGALKFEGEYLNGNRIIN